MILYTWASLEPSFYHNHKRPFPTGVEVVDYTLDSRGAGESHRLCRNISGRNTSSKSCEGKTVLIIAFNILCLTLDGLVLLCNRIITSAQKWWQKPVTVGTFAHVSKMNNVACAQLKFQMLNLLRRYLYRQSQYSKTWGSKGLAFMAQCLAHSVWIRRLGFESPSGRNIFCLKNLIRFQKVIRSCVENECCCPSTVNTLNVNFTSNVSLLPETVSKKNMGQQRRGPDGSNV